jgi:hypothetical protein
MANRETFPSNNPPERQRPTPIRGDLKRRTGPGVRYFPSSRIGPAIQTPAISNNQSARTKALEDAGVNVIHGEGTNTRSLSRDGLSLTQDDLYGRT